MKVLLKIIIVVLMISAFSGISHTMEILKQPPVEALKEMQETANQVLKEGITPSPEKAIPVLRYLILVAKGVAKEDPELTKVLAVRGGFQLGVKSVIDAGITVMINNMKEKRVFDRDGELGKLGIDEHLFTLWMKSAKNAILLDVKGAITDATFTVYRSWGETMQAVRELPPDAPMDDYLLTLYDVITYADALKKEKPYLSPLIDIYVFTGILPLALADGVKIIAKGAYQELRELFGPKPPSDASQQSLWTAQNLVSLSPAYSYMTGWVELQGRGIHSGAFVYLLGQSYDYSAVTDSTGYYRINNIPDGTFMPMAKAPGYETKYWGPNPLTWPGRHENVNFSLRPW